MTTSDRPLQLNKETKHTMNQQYMRIGEVAQLTGLHPNTIRRLEARGRLHPARDWTGTRRFTEADVQALRRLFKRPTRGSKPREATRTGRDAA